MIHPAIMKDTYHLNAWLKHHLDEVIAQHCILQPEGRI
jgi:hypothetical protein